MKIMSIDFDGCVKRFQVADTEYETIQKFLSLHGDFSWTIDDALEDCNISISLEDTNDVIPF